MAVVLAWAIIPISLHKPLVQRARTRPKRPGLPESQPPGGVQLRSHSHGVFGLPFRALSRTIIKHQDSHVCLCLAFRGGNIPCLNRRLPSWYAATRVWYFFAQTWLAIVAFAIDSYHTGRYLLATLFVLVAIMGPPGALLIKWPSVALLEIYGIILVDIFVAGLTLAHRPSAPGN